MFKPRDQIKRTKEADFSTYISELDSERFKCQICMLGTVLAGKSTIAAGIVGTCETMSTQIGPFYCYVLPTSTRILVDANQLMRGHFPVKTDPFQGSFESGFVISEKTGGLLGSRKKAHVPLFDIPGEFSDRVDPYNPGLDPNQARAQYVSQTIMKRIRDSQGFIVALPANEALMLKSMDSRVDVDAYTYHILSQIIEYKRKKKSSLEHIFIVLTKWDEARDQAQQFGMDVFDTSQNGLHRFMVNGFRSLSMLLKPFVEEKKVSVYRSYFEIRRNEDGSRMKWPDGSYVINTYEEENQDVDVRWRPEYAEQDYIQLVRDIGAMAK